MLEALNIVKGGVSTKELVPVLTHIRIHDGRIQGSNGSLYIDAPCDALKEINCVVPCAKLIVAVEACDGDPKIKLTEAGRLSLSNGGFRASLPVMPLDSYPAAELPKGKAKPSKNGDLLRRLLQIHEFIGVDASRPWACGALIEDGMVYATNNVILASAPVKFPGTFNLPSTAVEELLRINREPVAAWFESNCVTFDLGDGIWLRSQLYEAKDWPQSIKEMIAAVKKVPRIADGLLTAVQRIIPFCPDPNYPVIVFSKKGVSTTDGAISAEVTGLTLAGDAKFHSEPLMTVLNKATHFDAADYPRPSGFLGANDLRGLIAGIK